MAHFQWNPTLSTRIDAVDREHRELLDLANRLQATIDDGRSAREISDLLSELATRERRHFAREEQLMQEQQFPGYADHKNAHDDLAAKLANVQERFRAEEPIGSMTLLAFLHDWLVTHIHSHDRALGEYLTQKAAESVLPAQKTLKDD